MLNSYMLGIRKQGRLRELSNCRRRPASKTPSCASCVKRVRSAELPTWSCRVWLCGSVGHSDRSFSTRVRPASEPRLEGPGHRLGRTFLARRRATAWAMCTTYRSGERPSSQGAPRASLVTADTARTGTVGHMAHAATYVPCLGVWQSGGMERTDRDGLGEGHADLPCRIDAAVALNRLGHALVGHRADPEVLERIADAARQLAERIEHEPVRERGSEVGGNPRFLQAITERRPLGDIVEDGAFLDMFEDSPVSGSANPLSI